MPNFTATDYFPFDAQTFDMTALYARGFHAYNVGTTTTISRTSYVTVSSSSSNHVYDRTEFYQDGSSTVVRIVDNSSGSATSGSRTSITMESIKIFTGTQLLYSLDDMILLLYVAGSAYHSVNRSAFNSQSFYVRDNSFTTGAESDYLIGKEGNDTLSPGWGNDYAAGGIGNDKLYGGVGSDNLDGGEGIDYIDGGAGFDFARYDNSAGVVVRLDYGMGVNGEANGDQLVGIEGLIGSAHQDFLIGDVASNALLGQGGDDWLYGQGGNDELHGGDGSDQLIGGAGVDQMYGGAGNDQFWTLQADIQAGVWDYIYDFGESADNFDYLRFEGIAAAQLIIGDNDGNTVITTNELYYSGGIIILNFSGVQTLDQLIFA